MAMTKRVALYIRVSTEEQEQEGCSIDAQQVLLERYAQMKGWEVPHPPFVDVGSGREKVREEYLKVMVLIDEWDVLLVWKVDRLHRNLKNLLDMSLELEDRGKELVSVTESVDTTTPMGRVYFALCGSFAQLESEQTSMRTKMGMEHKAVHGGWITSPPYGYYIVEKGGKLLIKDDEAVVVKEIFRLRYQEDWTFSRIAHHLHGRNIPTKRKGTWDPNTVRRIIRSPVYYGKLRYGKHVYDGDHEAIMKGGDYID